MQMQRTAARFAKNDLAKYPFPKEASENVKKLDFDIADPVASGICGGAEARRRKSARSVTIQCASEP